MEILNEKKIQYKLKKFVGALKIVIYTLSIALPNILLDPTYGELTVQRTKEYDR
jgi:hypothetical protein